MGSSSSALDGQLSPDDIQHYVESTHFTHQQVIKLMQKYQELAGTSAIGGDGRIDEEEFITKMKIPNRQIGSIMYHMLDADGGGDIDFNEFVMGLNSFLPEADLAGKIDLCFKAYDMDGSNSISKDEVQSIIDMSLEGNTFINMEKAEMEQLLDDLFDEYDPQHTGDLTKEQFTKMVKKAPGILECFEFNMENIENDEE